MLRLSPLYRIDQVFNNWDVKMYRFWKFSCGFRFWSNFFSVLDDFFSTVLRFLISPNAPLLFSLFSGALCISVFCCSSLDIRLFTYAFSCSLSLSSRHILPILASFLTFIRVFLDSLYAFYSLLSLVALFLSFRPILPKTLSPQT